jgi:prepilin-type N-terminal cleavage/methylation domain-containing protein
MNLTPTSDFVPRHLPVRWVDSPVIGPLPLRRRKARRTSAEKMITCGFRMERRIFPMLPGRSLSAFTLLELMVVIAIIGFIAALALPHVGGIGQANSMTTATRQLLDDVGYARQRAMVSRSTVYMVFLPPMFWTNNSYKSPPLGYQTPSGSQVTNLVAHQYGAYALVSLSSVGDQPGRHYPHFLTDWKTLPSGVFIAPFEFELGHYNYTHLYTTNTLAGTIIDNVIYGWNTNYFTFPSLTTPNTLMPLPYIGFTPQGSLTTQFTNQYIALARGSILYPTDTNGIPLFEQPILSENPPNNDASNPNLIQIDWMTARATLVQNRLQ